MENLKWKEDLREHFKKHQIASISKKVEIVKNTITEWIDLIKNDSTLSVNFKVLNSTFNIELSERLYFDSLKIVITLDKLGEYLMISFNYTDIKFNQAYKEIQIEIDNELILKTLTKILIDYNG